MTNILPEFVSLAEVATNSRGPITTHGGRRILNGVAISKHSSKNNHKGQQITFLIGVEILKQSRFMHGDRVDILVDRKNRYGLIRRVLTSGYALSGKGPKRKDGTTSGATIRMTYYPGMPLPKEYTLLESINVTNEGIMFVFPESVAL